MLVNDGDPKVSLTPFSLYSFPAFEVLAHPSPLPPSLPPLLPQVSPASARMYGLVQATDQAVTFLLVNGACHLSDKYGRRPFMALANMGLGTGKEGGREGGREGGGACHMYSEG